MCLRCLNGPVPAPVASQADGELREEIAATICESDGEVWTGERSAFCDDYRKNADAVLALPAVRQLLADAAAVQRVRELAEEFDRPVEGIKLNGLPQRALFGGGDVCYRIRRALDGGQ